MKQLLKVVIKNNLQAYFEVCKISNKNTVFAQVTRTSFKIIFRIQYHLSFLI